MLFAEYFTKHSTLKSEWDSLVFRSVAPRSIPHSFLLELLSRIVPVGHDLLQNSITDFIGIHACPKQEDKLPVSYDELNPKI